MTDSPCIPLNETLVPLESILCTEELSQRPARVADYLTENRALLALAQALVESPRTILQSLSDTILALLKADSAGISLLTQDEKRFYWPAIAGKWRSHIGGGTPRESGPCGDVLDCNAPLLFKHFERRYPYLQAATPLAEECLLVPFYVAGKAVGTVWAVLHDTNRRFDAEDLRQLQSLGKFASAAYQATESLNIEKEFNRSIIDSSPDCIQVLDLDGNLLSVLSGQALLGIEDIRPYVHKPWVLLWESEDRQAARAAIDATLEGRDGRFVGLFHTVDGEPKWWDVAISRILDNNYQPARLLAVLRDATERKHYEARIAYLAGHDALTALANRNLLGDRVAQAMCQAHRTGETLLALLFLDLDRFKVINDSYGHTIGDMLLKAVAARLVETLREGDTVARQGGDEFIILLVGVRDVQEIISAVTKIIHAFTTPFAVDCHLLHMTASIGVTVFPHDGEDMPTLLCNADTAMYRAKENNGNTFQFYSREMSERATERAEMENALRTAIAREEFELFYQPKVELCSGKVIGAEALIRWNHPEMGLMMPQRFIPLAEEVGLIVQIGDWVLRTAHAQNKAWKNSGLPPLKIAVNLSVRQFMQEGLVEAVAQVLRDTGLDGSYLELELTESMVMHNAEHFIVKLNRLKALGIELSIDDFGTGYSSLSYLKRFPLDRLKIDQSFIRDSATHAMDAAITRSVIDLGHRLNFKVIAEGVETSEQLAFLRANRCDEIQGYYFSKPVPAAEFAALLGAGWHLKKDDLPTEPEPLNA